MRDEHIKKLLDEAPLASLGSAELARVRAHAEGCADCRRAFEAARAASFMMKARAAEAFEPSPFFQTRVMAALRERQAANDAWPLRRMWRTAGALVSSMAAVVAALAVFTFVAPAPPTTTGPEVVSAVRSCEEMIFDEGELPAEQMSDGQVLATIYGSDEDAEQ